MSQTTGADWLTGSGAMEALFRATDWRQTPLGAIEAWPQSLRSALSICLGTRFPIALYWGPQFVLLYNAMYSPIPGNKHPWALGRPAEEAWSEIWSTLDPMFHGVVTTGEAVYFEDSLLVMDRHGYLEECYFNFTISPIRGESGQVEGLFNAVIETTYRFIAERRTRLLRELGARTAAARTPEEACALAAEALGSVPADVPFCAVYLIDKAGECAHLAGVAGLHTGSAAAPASVSLIEPNSSVWPLNTTPSSGVKQVDQLTERFGLALPGGAWPEPARSALITRIQGPANRELGFLIVGVSPRRAADDEYRLFVERAASQLATVIGTATAHEEERRRAEALAEVNRAKTTFFSNVSHEFRTPLTLMLGPTQDALESPERALSGEDLEAVYRNQLRLLKLVNTLLDFARIEAGRAQAAFELTDLAQLTGDLASVFRSAIEKAGIELLVDCPPLAGPVYVDRTMWEKIVFNLLSNALKFTPTGRIVVRQVMVGDHLVLSIEDTGCGIPAAEIGNVFNRFYRIEGTASRTYEGTGIGLSLVEELAHLHGGVVGVESALGRGSTFTVSLPLGSAHLPADRIGGERTLISTEIRADAYVVEALRWLPGAEPHASPRDDGPLYRVLVADDNADMRGYLCKLLGAHFDVIPVGDGEAAWVAILERKPDLVVTDVMMPKLDGFGLLARLRGEAKTRSLPVLMLSARAGEEARSEGIEAGADDYLVKPFSARELVARVWAKLEAARHTRLMEEKNVDLDRFAYVLSHDLKAPLRAIDKLSRWIEQEIGPSGSDETRQNLVLLRGRVQRMENMIQGILTYARIGRTPSVEEVDVAHLVTETIDSLAPPDALRITVQDQLPMLVTDRVQLGQVFANLIGNAIKHHDRKNGSVKVTCAAREREYEFVVADDGPGIAKRFQEKIFDLFQALSPNDQNTGIGLAICKKIVESHGGCLSVDSDFGRGAQFRFTWPRAPLSNRLHAKIN